MRNLEQIDAGRRILDVNEKRTADTRRRAVGFLVGIMARFKSERFDRAVASDIDLLYEIDPNKYLTNFYLLAKISVGFAGGQ